MLEWFDLKKWVECSKYLSGKRGRLKFLEIWFLINYIEKCVKKRRHFSKVEQDKVWYSALVFCINLKESKFLFWLEIFELKMIPRPNLIHVEVLDKSHISERRVRMIPVKKKKIWFKYLNKKNFAYQRQIKSICKSSHTGL